MQCIPRRRYTEDFKAQAVSLAESIGPTKAGRQLDISVKALATRSPVKSSPFVSNMVPAMAYCRRLWRRG